ncbi:probable inactive receptor kinase RLK902 [Triticum dicoccoides]|uniref:probable inactive receptor kinase RLK902 n=1 Tax=Triticum dicoccoides TaxID=85692 RepID=UPI00162D900C|nr:probable inactive receptor kinase RLK902 [Triticum dicoccoides]
MAPGLRFPPAFALLHLAVTLLAVLPRHVVPDLAGDRDALLALRAAVGNHLKWDQSVSPCQGWQGVSCSPGPNQRVVELRLVAKSLSGQIPVGTVGNLTALQTLSLRFNAISGPIPADIGGCTQLRWLYLKGNRFEGDIPESFFSLALLKKTDLSENRLTGGVSSEFNKLGNLATLNLEGNNLNGALPSGLDLPKLTQFNVSYNGQIDGPVPASLAGLPASAFLGTALCGGPLAACPNSDSEAHKSRKLTLGVIVGIIIAALVVLIIILSICVLIFSRRRRAAAGRSTEAAADVHEGTEPITVTVAMTGRDAVKRSHSPPGSPLIGDGKKLVFLGSAPERPYDLETMLRASAEVLGKGVHGTTYRATLDGGEPVLAIKRLRDVHLPEREFRDRVVALGALRHDNLPGLRAYFYSKEEKLLVFDFVGAGSLSSLLHGSGAERLDFTTRARIALAAARGVAFIHGGGPKASHGSIKASNVVVSGKRDSAYMADYGLAQLVGTAGLPKRGTGYRAPEVTDARVVSQKADVYSFGVVVLELLTGRAPTHALPDGGAGGSGVDLARWVRSVVQEEWTSEVFDSVIGSEPRVEEEMMRLLQLGMECTEQHPDRRPTMAEVEARIERIVEDASRRADFSSTDGSRSVSA